VNLNYVEEHKKNPNAQENPRSEELPEDFNPKKILEKAIFEMLKQQQQELYGGNKKSMDLREHSRAASNFYEASNGLTKRSHVPSGRSFPMTKMSHR